MNAKLPTTAAALALAWGAAGCGPARPPVVIGKDPGTTTVLVENDLERGLELRKLRVSIDGESVPASTIPPRGDGPVVVVRAKLAPGAHTLGLVAAAAHAGSDEVTAMRSTESFRVGRAPAVLRVTIAPSSADRSSVAARVAIEGGALEPPIDAPPVEGSDRCSFLEGVSASLCRGERELADAARARDPARTACIQDKLPSLRLIAETLPTTSADPALREEANARASALASAIERCGGAFAVIGPDGVTRSPM